MSMLALVFFLQSAFAQIPSQKIEVFADAEAPLESRVFSIDSLNLNREYKQNSEENYLEIPNLNFAGGTNRPRYLQIRGVGETSTYENTPSHSVTYLIDDIDLTGIIASWPQMNMATLQVDKGPQSTFWGGSSTGGVVHTTLNRTDAPSQARLTLGSRPDSNAAAQGGVELNLSSRSRLFLYHNNDPGFYKNSYLGKNGAAQNEYYVSLTNELFHSENWQISSTHLALKTHNGYDVWSLNNNLKTISDRLGQDSQQVQGHSLKIQRRFDGGNSLNSLSSIAISDSTYSYDADWGNNSYWQSIPGWNQNYDYFDEFVRRRTAWHQKLFFTHRSSSVGVHLYGLNERTHIDHFKNNNLKSALGSNYRSHSAALFGDWRKEISARQSLQLAARYEFQKLDYEDSSLAQGTRRDQFFSFQAEWRKSFFSNSYLFAKINSGFKNAGVNIENTLTDDRRYYEPEKVINYEIGVQRQEASRTWSLDIFYMDQRQKQVKVSKQDDPMDPSTYTYFTSNAARGATTGLEGRVQQRWQSWQTEMQLGLLDAVFKDYEFEGRSLGGRRVAHAPSWSYALSVSRSWSENFSSNLSMIGKNSFYFSNNHDQMSSVTHLMNFGTTFKRGPWTWNLWINNLLNRPYQTRGFYFANEPPTWENKLYLQQGLPRTVGLSANYQF